MLKRYEFSDCKLIMSYYLNNMNNLVYFEEDSMNFLKVLFCYFVI